MRGLFGLGLALCLLLAFGGTAAAQTAGSCPVGQYRAEYFANRTLSGSPASAGCEGSIHNDDVRGSQLTVDRTGKQAERLVPHRVALTVVDDLEVVDVDSDQRDGVALPLGPAKVLTEPFLEGAVVEQAGQRVLERLERIVGHPIGIASQHADLVGAAPS